MDLEKLKAVDPVDAEIDTLIDISEISIDINLPKAERTTRFLEQIKNPYVFRCGDLIVKSVFADTEISLDERMEQYFRLGGGYDFGED